MTLQYHDDAQVVENTFRHYYSVAAETYEKLMENFEGTDADDNFKVFSALVQELGRYYGHLARNGFDLPPVAPFEQWDAAIEKIASADFEVAFTTAASFFPDTGDTVPSRVVQTVRCLLDRRARGLSNVPRSASDTSFGGRPGFLDTHQPLPGEVRSIRKAFPDVDERLRLLATLLHATCQRQRQNAILRERERIRQMGHDAREAKKILAHAEKVISALEKSPKLAPGPRDIERLQEVANHLGRIVLSAPQDEDSEQTEERSDPSSAAKREAKRSEGAAQEVA